MIINLGSISFNADISSGGGTPAWGTEMGQGEGYKFAFENFEEFITALVYNRVDESKVYCPLGKGGNRTSDYEFVIASLFKKIFINGLYVKNSSFLLLVVKKLIGNNHVGRRSLKYNPSMTYDGVNYNKGCYDNMAKTLGLSQDSAWFVHEINVKNQDELHFTAYIINSEHGESYIDSGIRKNKYLELINKDGKEYEVYTKVLPQSIIGDIQQIYYGAPGTGKSHTINEKTEGESVIRTTFHPDSDYSTFVGAYKPTMDLLPICNEIGQEMKLGNTVLHKEQIVYKFVSQAFLQAYVQAWKYYAEDAEEVKKQFLVIEEINRGNCAQIFGDLFQLLDRNDSGFSDYPIKADEDMKKYLSKELHDLEINNAEGINALYKGRNVVNEVINGDILLLPNNLYIWATMNTSDQSLFPIDSAFKRRWDWQYVPINKGYDKDGKEIQWVIEAGNKRYDWWDFLEKINHEIDDTTHAEGKKLGFFFCKAEDNIVSAEKFVSKVVFYLWNDVFKNYGFDKPFFKKEDGKTLAFSDFYESDNSGNTSVRADVVEMFLDKLKVYGVEAEFTSEANEIEPSTVIKVNGKQTKFKNEIPYTAIEEYVRLNSDKTAQEIYDIWEPFKKCSIRKWIVLNKEDYDNMNENERNYSYKIDCADGNSIWVNKDGWTYHPQKKNIKDSISAFIKAVHEANLGITITEESI